MQLVYIYMSMIINYTIQLFDYILINFLWIVSDSFIWYNKLLFYIQFFNVFF